MSRFDEAMKRVHAEGVTDAFYALRGEMGGKLKVLWLLAILVIFVAAGAVSVSLLYGRSSQARISAMEQRLVSLDDSSRTFRAELDAERLARMESDGNLRTFQQCQTMPLAPTPVATWEGQIQELRSEKQWLQDKVLKLEDQVDQLRKEVFKEGQLTRIGLEWEIIASKLGWKVLTRGDVGVLYKYDNPYEPPTPQFLDDFSGFDVLNGVTGYFLVWAGTNEDPLALDGHRFYRVQGIQLDQKLWAGGSYREFAKVVGMTSDLPEYSQKKFTVPIHWWPLSEAEYTSLLYTVQDWPR